MSDRGEEYQAISNEVVETLANAIEEKRDQYRKRATCWKNWFRIVIVGAAIASASAAVLPKLDFLISNESPSEEERILLEKIESIEERKIQEESFQLRAEIVDMQKRSDIAVLLAFTATILTSLIGLLDFESYWHANRQARHRLEALLVLVRYKPTDMGEVEYNNYLQEFRSILLERADHISPAAFQLVGNPNDKG